MPHKDFWDKREIYPSITTFGISWENLLDEINLFKLDSVCVFLTCLKIEGRKKLYSALEKSTVRRVPLVHLKHDMDLWELEFFMKNFQTRHFNIHSQKQFAFKHNLEKYKDYIYIENGVSFSEKEAAEWAGICLDISHLEDARLTDNKRYQHDLAIIKKFPCGVNHISPVRMGNVELILQGKKPIETNWHIIEDNHEFDYLKNYSSGMFSNILAMEAKNTIKEQLEAIEYIKDLLKNN